MPLSLSDMRARSCLGGLNVDFSTKCAFCPVIRAGWQRASAVAAGYTLRGAACREHKPRPLEVCNVTIHGRGQEVLG